MRGMRWLLYVTLVSLGAVVLFGVMAWAGPRAAAQGTPPPPRPAWVGENGVVDLTKVPECFTIVGPDGKQVVDTNGKAVCGKPFDLPENEAPEEVKKRSVPSGTGVPGKRPPGVPSPSSVPSGR